ncbi:hypothetical protein CY34DRAFT_618100 [Suillus luteus UH-Slu-Lm8-n1]|uniref:Unplaced genomic scaffold CY34scaffold_577, whole genome shotgun sequence n=1 Tax=Suillus luteus UH-Slu-Lm8-n1 TaxID=930992 RepID=A0A0D0ARZ3_9AGAM|nr:hypothetical protein CY34DRAFT_618100 [Suillus luteus UH-Slu-Lm8-n1]
MRVLLYNNYTAAMLRFESSTTGQVNLEILNASLASASNSHPHAQVGPFIVSDFPFVLHMQRLSMVAKVFPLTRPSPRCLRTWPTLHSPFTDPSMRSLAYPVAGRQNKRRFQDVECCL